MEKFNFDPEAAASRAELIGHLKIDRGSEESQRLLEEWAKVGERLVETGALDQFEWHREEAEVYVEAEQTEAALWVLKVALYEIYQQGLDSKAGYFYARIKDLGGDPEDFSDIENG